MKDFLPKTCEPIVVNNVLTAVANITEKFYPNSVEDKFDNKVLNIENRNYMNVIHGKNVLIGESVKIGTNCWIGHNTIIEKNVEIGNNCSIGDNCTLSHCELDDGCRLQAGVVLGAAGFGFEITGDTPVMIPHIGILRLGRGVCVGANSAIDRGSLGDTVIGDFVMIDNLVHIAHNCEIGERCVIAGQVGIAGSTILEAGVMIGGQAGIGDHLRIGKNAVILARSGVTKDVPAGAKMVGFPAIEAGQYWRDQAAVRQVLRTRAAAGKKTPPKV